MKRLFLAICVVLVAVACDNREGGNENLPKYAIGDVYDADGVQGVVFTISEGGIHGKIVSVEETAEKVDWRTANLWCKGLGEGWYCPNIDELSAIYGVVGTINKTLEGLDAEEIKAMFYWSSESKDEDYAYYVSMMGGASNHASKGFTTLARAVKAF